MIPKVRLVVSVMAIILSMTFVGSAAASAETPNPSISPSPISVDTKAISSPMLSSDSKSQSWNFEFPIDSSGNPQKPGQATPKAFSFGICTGSFQNIVKQGAYLVWGAQSACTASNNIYYLHQVRVDLYDSCLYGLCIFFEKTKSMVSPSSSSYSRVATVNGYDLCRGTKFENSRTYEQRVYVTIRDVTYGPFAQQSGIPYCDIQP